VPPKAIRKQFLRSGNRTENRNERRAFLFL